MRDTNKISYHRREKSVDDKGYLTGVAAVAVKTAAVVAAAARAILKAIAGLVIGMVVSALVVVAVPVVVAESAEAAEATVIISTNTMISLHGDSRLCINGDGGWWVEGGIRATLVPLWRHAHATPTPRLRHACATLAPRLRHSYTTLTSISPFFS